MLKCGDLRSGAPRTILSYPIPNKARGVSFSAPDIKSVKGRSLVIDVDVVADLSFLSYST